MEHTEIVSTLASISFLIQPAHTVLHKPLSLSMTTQTGLQTRVFLVVCLCTVAAIFFVPYLLGGRRLIQPKPQDGQSEIITPFNNHTILLSSTLYTAYTHKKEVLIITYTCMVFVLYTVANLDCTTCVHVRTDS